LFVNLSYLLLLLVLQYIVKFVGVGYLDANWHCNIVTIMAYVAFVQIRNMDTT